MVDILHLTNRMRAIRLSDPSPIRSDSLGMAQGSQGGFWGVEGKKKGG